MGNTVGVEIVRRALKVQSVEDATQVQQTIERAVGARYERPVGDRWNNQGLLTASGASFDHKVLEGVTNMQDAVLELWVRRSHGPADADAAFQTPQEAAASAYAGMSEADLAKLVNVTLRPFEGDRGQRAVNIVMRDLGCGMTGAQVPRTIFQLGAGHKNGVDWLQGTFGLGGATMYRNAQAVVLITRCHPDLLAEGEPDEIVVAIVEWSTAKTTTNAAYLVTEPWDAESPGRASLPYAVPAADCPEFEPGTHLALIGFTTGGLGRKSGDEKSFDTVFNTRIFAPVSPISYQNPRVRDRVETLRGLQARLDNNRVDEAREGVEAMPFRIEGTTYHLPVRYRLFEKPGERGERRKFVAHGHAVMLTSNGQVHSHWTPDQFHRRTRHNKLRDRVLVVVETDAIPLKYRARLFTADRSDTAKVGLAVRLEDELASFLNDWPALHDANSILIREAVQRGSSKKSTIDAARKISRALNVKGFSAGGAGRSGGSRSIPKAALPEDLLPDPTHLEGPAEIMIERGTTRGVYIRLNGIDGFVGRDGKAELSVTTNHPDIREEDVVAGTLKAGRLRVAISVPETEELGEYEIDFVVAPWLRKAGGATGGLRWRATLRVVDTMLAKESGNGGSGSGRGNSGPTNDGNLIAILWTKEESHNAVGDLVYRSGADIADDDSNYEELRGIEAEIPTLTLNEDFAPLKRYMHERSGDASDSAIESARERYAVGCGVAVISLAREFKKSGDGPELSEALLNSAKVAAARGVLAVLPDYDLLARSIED